MKKARGKARARCTRSREGTADSERKRTSSTIRINREKKEHVKSVKATKVKNRKNKRERMREAVAGRI
jgi:hypothetical protein